MNPRRKVKRMQNLLTGSCDCRQFATQPPPLPPPLPVNNNPKPPSVLQPLHLARPHPSAQPPAFPGGGNPNCGQGVRTVSSPPAPLCGALQLGTNELMGKWSMGREPHSCQPKNPPPELRPRQDLAQRGGSVSCLGQEGSSAEPLGPTKDGATSVVHVHPQRLSFPVCSSVPSLQPPNTFWRSLERFTAFLELLLKCETQLKARGARL